MSFCIGNSWNSFRPLKKIQPYNTIPIKLKSKQLLVPSLFIGAFGKCANLLVITGWGIIVNKYNDDPKSL